ncbi:MAG TPA: ATP-binding protein [Candidatus Dormibacteraeota bacterium]|nr:ATP-binding protein [Candidatus Dormibacteraeota bacterium]
MAGDRITVRERLTPEITASLFANYRTAADAIFELVDNSVDSRLPGRPLRVDLTVRPAFIQVTTIGGQGMGPREVEAHYLRWGTSAKRGRNLIGRYGQGGKAAIGHLGQGFTIDASRPGDESAWQFSDTRYRDRSRLKVYELHPIAKRVERELGYVRIRIEAVDRKVDVKRLSARLLETYRPLLETEALALTVNGVALRPAPFSTVERHEFDVAAGGGRLRGWYGVLAEAGPPAEPGLRCYRLGRLVGGGESFGHPTLARLVGEVDVPNVPLTMNKADFDRDSEAWVEVEERMHGLLAPLVGRLSSAAPPPPAGATRVAEQVRRLLGRALRMVDGEAPIAGFEAAAPPGRDAAASTQQELAMPPGRAGSRVGRIALRPLARTIRSQTIEEDGARVIVINTRHPLFLERRGDTWYQLETAAREVFAALEGVSVAEYERRVNEVVLLALDLRTRRRRGPRRRPPQLDLLG